MTFALSQKSAQRAFVIAAASTLIAGCTARPQTPRFVFGQDNCAVIDRNPQHSDFRSICYNNGPKARVTYPAGGSRFVDLDAIHRKDRETACIVLKNC